MLKAIAAGFVLLTMLAAGCSSDSDPPAGFSCDNAKSKCPNDPPFPPAECKAALGHPTCGNAFMTFFLCVGEHQTCLADGTTDTTVTERECAMEDSALTQCLSMDAGGGGG
jgi:hypothetical protein